MGHSCLVKSNACICINIFKEFQRQTKIAQEFLIEITAHGPHEPQITSLKCNENLSTNTNIVFEFASQPPAMYLNITYYQTNMIKGK